jgi:hypothetical protein
MLSMIKSFDQVSVDWVAQVLRVPTYEISSISVRRLWDPFLFRIAVVDIDYQSKTHDKPASVFLKITRDDLPKELSWIGKKETFFYKYIVPRFRSENIPLCYSARFDEENKLFNLVLEDLSRTHFQVAYPLAPRSRYMEAAVRCLAKIHADWWDREELRQVTDGYPTEKRFSEWTDYLRKSGLELLEFLGDALPQVGHRIVRTLLDHREVVSKRYLSGENLT